MAFAHCNSQLALSAGTYPGKKLQILLKNNQSFTSAICIDYDYTCCNSDGTTKRPSEPGRFAQLNYSYLDLLLQAGVSAVSEGKQQMKINLKF